MDSLGDLSADISSYKPDGGSEPTQKLLWDPEGVLLLVTLTTANSAEENQTKPCLVMMSRCKAAKNNRENRDGGHSGGTLGEPKTDQENKIHMPSINETMSLQSHGSKNLFREQEGKAAQGAPAPTCSQLPTVHKGTQVRGRSPSKLGAELSLLTGSPAWLLFGKE